MKSLKSSHHRNHFKASLGSILAAFALSACATTAPIGKPVAVSAAEDIRLSARTAAKLMVYEGLPHQAHERELLGREAARADVTRIAGYPFYTPARPAKQPEELRRILGDAESYGVYRGPKTCGGFHPDYAVSWGSGGGSHHILICFGCGEALVSDGGRMLPYDLREPALGQLRALLSRHALKRPPVER